MPACISVDMDYYAVDVGSVVYFDAGFDGTDMIFRYLHDCKQSGVLIVEWNENQINTSFSFFQVFSTC